MSASVSRLVLHVSCATSGAAELPEVKKEDMCRCVVQKLLLTTQHGYLSRFP